MSCAGNTVLFYVNDEEVYKLSPNEILRTYLKEVRTCYSEADRKDILDEYTKLTDDMIDEIMETISVRKLKHNIISIFHETNALYYETPGFEYVTSCCGNLSN